LSGFKRSCAELISASPTYFGRVDYLGKTNPEPIKFVDIQEHVQIFALLIITVIFSF
jgi:hypothetical protein